MARTTSTRSKAKSTSKSTGKTTSRSRSSTTAASTPTPAAPEPVVVQKTEPVVSAPDLKKADLVNQVVERSGVKKKWAKPSVEAALEILGEALGEGRALNLRPMGKVKVLRSKEVSNGTVLTTRVRQPLASRKEAEPADTPE